MTCHCQHLTCIPLERSARFGRGGEQEKEKEAMGSGQAGVGRAGEHVWPHALAANGGGTLQRTHHCSLEGPCGGGGAQSHALRPQLWSSLTPVTGGPDPGEGSAVLRPPSWKTAQPRTAPGGAPWEGNPISPSHPHCEQLNGSRGDGVLRRRDGDRPQGRSPGPEAATGRPGLRPQNMSPSSSSRLNFSVMLVCY